MTPPPEVLFYYNTVRVNRHFLPENRISLQDHPTAKNYQNILYDYHLLQNENFKKHKRSKSVIIK